MKFFTTGNRNKKIQEVYLVLRENENNAYSIHAFTCCPNFTVIKGDDACLSNHVRPGNLPTKDWGGGSRVATSTTNSIQSASKTPLLNFDAFQNPRGTVEF